MSTQERKEAIRISANESKLWECLNEAVDLLPSNCTFIQLKKKAKELYKQNGFSSLPFLNQQKVFKNYLRG